MPNGTFNVANAWLKPNESDQIEITGTVSGTTTAEMYVNGGNKQTLSVVGSNYSVSYPSSVFGDGGNYSFKLRVIKDNDQNMVMRNYNVDTQEPVIAITGIVGDGVTGKVNGDNVSGKVTIKGTYTDNFADNLANEGARTLKLVLMAVQQSVSPTKITRICRHFFGLGNMTGTLKMIVRLQEMG